MSTYQEAEKAKEFLKTFLPEGYAVGIGKESDSYVVAVRVQELTDSVHRILPKEIDGVKITVEETGTIRARHDRTLEEEYNNGAAFGPGDDALEFLGKKETNG